MTLSATDRALSRCALRVALVSIWIHCVTLRVQGVPPNAVAANVQWNLAHFPILGIGPGGLRPNMLFQNSQNCTFTMHPASTTWHRFVVQDYNGALLRMTVKHLPTANTKTIYRANLIAQNSEGSDSIEVIGILPPPLPILRFPSVNRTIPLTQQRSVRINQWYTDAYPPDDFKYLPTFQGRNDILGVTVGPKGQPDRRVDLFDDPELRNNKYDWQGMKYSINRQLPLGVGVTITASIYIPKFWVTGAPGSNGCLGEDYACARAIDFAIELGQGPSGSREPTFRLHAGFDNRDADFKNFGPFVYLYADGPITDKLETPGVWPFSELGTLLAFGFPGSLPRKIPAWANVVKLDDWNEFSINVQRSDFDFAIYQGNARRCAEVMLFQWYGIVGYEAENAVRML